jgi:TolB-like protein
VREPGGRTRTLLALPRNGVGLRTSRPAHEAEAAVKDLLALDPEFAAHVRSNVESWHFASGLMDPLLEGLRKAGLEISDAEPASISSTPRLPSVETRAGEGFWVAVLPFKFTGSNSEVATLAEGLSEEIVTGLSRFSYLRVIARSSTLRYASESSDVRTIGKTLGARYVMEGTLRQAGPSYALPCNSSMPPRGAHLWQKTTRENLVAKTLLSYRTTLFRALSPQSPDWYGASATQHERDCSPQTSRSTEPVRSITSELSVTSKISPLKSMPLSDPAWSEPSIKNQATLIYGPCFQCCLVKNTGSVQREA